MNIRKWIGEMLAYRPTTRALVVAATFGILAWLSQAVSVNAAYNPNTPALTFNCHAWLTLALCDAASTTAGAADNIDSGFTLSGSTVLNAPAVTFAGGTITRGTFTLSCNCTGIADSIMFDRTGTGAVTFTNHPTTIYARWFGAVPDGATDSTTPIQQAGNSAITASSSLTLGSGTYATSACLKWGTFPNTSSTPGGIFDVKGQGEVSTQILSSNGNDCLLAISNVSWGSISAMTIGFANSVTIGSGSTNAIGLEIPSWRRGSISNLKIVNTYKGILTSDNSTSCSGGACNFSGTYNLEVSTVDISLFYQDAIDLEGTGGNTNWQNVRMENGSSVSPGDVFGPVILINTQGETNWNVLNIEASKLHGSGIQIGSAAIIHTFSKLHFESDVPVSSGSGNANGLIVLLANSFINIDGFSVSGSTFTNTNITSGTFSMITTNSFVGGGASVSNFLWNDTATEHNTVTGMTTMVMFNTAENSAPSASYYYLNYFQNLGSSPITIDAYGNMAASNFKQYLITNGSLQTPRPLVQVTNQGDAALTSLCDRNRNYVRWDTTLTTNRNWTLSATGAYPGCSFWGRTGGVTNNVVVVDGVSSSTIATLTPKTSGIFIYNGANWETFSLGTVSP